MRNLLLLLAAALPLAASAAPATNDDATYAPIARRAIAIEQVARQPNPHDDAGLNGEEIQDAAPTPPPTHASRADRMADCDCC